MLSHRLPTRENKRAHHSEASRFHKITEDPAHSPYSMLFRFLPSAFRCSSTTVQHQSDAPEVEEGGAKQIKAVRGSVDSVAINLARSCPTGSATRSRSSDEPYF